MRTTAASERSRECWSEALAIEEAHGAVAPAIIGERIRTLALAGDEAGLARWRAVEERYDQLQAYRTMRSH